MAALCTRVVVRLLYSDAPDGDSNTCSTTAPGRAGLLTTDNSIGTARPVLSVACVNDTAPATGVPMNDPMEIPFMDITARPVPSGDIHASSTVPIGPL